MKNVRDFGAVGDGVADDTAAIVAAIAAANVTTYDVVYLPAGRYRTTAPITYSPWRVRLVGDGAQLTTILPTIPAGQYAFTLGWDPATEPGWRRGPFNAMECLTLETPLGVDQPHGIILDAMGASGHAHSMTFRDLSIVGFETQVTLADYVYLINFDRVFFHQPNLWAVSMDNPSTTGENIGFSSCNFSGGTGGVYINKSGAAFYFSQCSFDYMRRAVWQRAGSTAFSQCHFETGAAQGSAGSEYLLLDRRGTVVRPVMTLTDCDVYPLPTSYDTLIRLRGDYGDQAVRVTNPYLGGASPMCPYLIRDDGPTHSNIVVSGAFYSRGDYPPLKIRKQDGTDYTITAGPAHVLT